MWRTVVAVLGALAGSAWFWLGPGLPVAVTLHLEPRQRETLAAARQEVRVQSVQSQAGAQQLRLPGLLPVGTPTVLRLHVPAPFPVPLAVGDAGRFDRLGALDGPDASLCVAFVPLYPELWVTAIGGPLDAAGRVDVRVESGAGARPCESPHPAGPVVSLHP